MGPAATAAVAGAPATPLRPALLLAGGCWGVGAGPPHPHALAGARSALGGDLSAPDARAPGVRRCDSRLAGLRHLPGTPGPGVADRAFGGHGRTGCQRSRHRDWPPEEFPCPSLPCHHGREPTIR